MTKARTPTEMSKGQVTTQTTPQKSSIKQRLRTDLGRSFGVTKATQLVWLTGLRAHLPTNRNSRVIKRTHILHFMSHQLAFHVSPTSYLRIIFSISVVRLNRFGCFKYLSRAACFTLTMLSSYTLFSSAVALCEQFIIKSV